MPAQPARNENENLKDDHIMTSDDENETSVEPLPRNGDENTIEKWFQKNCVVTQTPFHEHAK
eukprot:11169964-Ditylum_brightwellii.AAC.1